MILFSKNRATRIHQKVVLSGKCKFRWKVPATCRRKHDHLAARALRDCGSLAVGSLRNTEEFLLANGQTRGKHHTVLTMHNLRARYASGDVSRQMFVDLICCFLRDHGSLVMGG